MKKILTLILSCLLLCGCNTIKPMTFKEAELNKDEKELLILLAKYGQFNFFDFNVDSTVNEMIISFYKLGDEDWEIIKQLTVNVSNTTGRILISDSDFRDYLQVSCEIDDEYYHLFSSEIDESTIITGGGSLFAGEQKIIRDHEITLAVQVWTEKIEIDTLGDGSLSQLYSFYSERDYEEVYIVTVRFK